jgi:hypothetical protein
LIRLLLRSVTAGFFLLAAGMLYLQYTVPMRWPVAAGRVEQASVVETGEHDSSGGPGTRFVLAVAYSYQIGDRLYEAREVTRFRWIYWSRERAARYLEEKGIRRGAEIPVYYNPAEPAEAVLVRELPWNRWDLRLAFLVLVLLPLAVVGYTLRDFRRGGISRRHDKSRGRFW